MWSMGSVQFGTPNRACWYWVPCRVRNHVRCISTMGIRAIVSGLSWRPCSMMTAACAKAWLPIGRCVRRDFALRHHMALWDVIASCDIEGASDASIRNAVPNDFSGMLRRSRISHIFTTGAKAAQLYWRLCVPLLRSHGLDDVPMTRLPSTSPANAGMSLPRLIEAYDCVGRAVS